VLAQAYIERRPLQPLARRIRILGDEVRGIPRLTKRSLTAEIPG
jgi:hypothetical protein